MTRKEMPLFPLQTVLFPGAPLPLVIFEERYKVMLQELLDSGGEFGVVLIRQGREVGGDAEPFDVGTLARIEQCDEVEGGRYRVQARGLRRFRLLNMLPARPYPYGEIELLDDSTYTEEERLFRAVETVRTVFPLYFKMALMLTDQWARGITLPESPHRLVNFLAPWLQVDEEVKQRLLELDSAADRVGYLAEVLDELVERTRDEVEEYRLRKWATLGVMS
ncbi:MAG: LON peptidase substrate-binding domain-containing protein [Dehalococcoidia bacterium]|nr:LON peptidase substrate-binding domain-containing protein [Dehalococcoidia bacterium]